MTRYPILVERWAHEGASMTIVCETCHAEEVIGPDDLVNDALYACPRGISACGGTATYKYDEALKCEGCGKLGYWEETLAYCCSRVCQLQAEYAASLASGETA